MINVEILENSVRYEKKPLKPLIISQVKLEEIPIGTTCLY